MIFHSLCLIFIHARVQSSHLGSLALCTLLYEAICIVLIGGTNAALWWSYLLSGCQSIRTNLVGAGNPEIQTRTFLL